jgi:hypothetical protein
MRRGTGAFFFLDRCGSAIPAGCIVPSCELKGGRETMATRGY